MEKDPRTNLYELVRNLSIVEHKKRQEFLVHLIEGIVSSRSVLFSEIAERIDKEIKTSSIIRRIQDFFQKVEFDFKQLISFFLSFIPHDQMTLSIDRTEWDYGNTQVNILCVVVSIGKMAVPLYFDVLDNKSGNSNSSDRKVLFETIIDSIGRHRISMLIMDREFIGHKWLSWLKRQRIPFCVRVPKHHKITLADGECVRVEQFIEGRKGRYARDVCVNCVVVNLSVSYGSDGELLYLIGSESPNRLQKIYKKRWTIEVFFQALKGRGFNMERSALKCIKKYRKLFAVVSMAYTICWATGIYDGRTNPVKVKNHGYPQYSVFRRGLNFFREYYKTKCVNPLTEMLHLIKTRMTHILQTVG